MTDKKTKPTRKDLVIGMLVKTEGLFDNLDVNNQLAKVIEFKEYGRILVEFLSSFSTLLHAGHKDIGKPKFCYYVGLENLSEVIPDELAQKIINKDVLPYKASSNLLKIFKKMKFEPTEEYLDISYFDVNEKSEDEITYLPAKKFEGDPDTKKGRQGMKIGRILKRLAPAMNEKQVEEAVAQYKGGFKIIILKEGRNIDVVTGEDIRYWYANTHYAKPKSGSSQLWSSCMSGPNNGRVFNIYAENPDKIALCIYTNEDDLLCARALLWRLDDGRVYMDRIYFNDPQDQQLLLDYAKQNGMVIRGNVNNRMEVTLPKDYAKKHRPANGNPYMDTFRQSVIRKDGTYYATNGVGTDNQAREVNYI